MPKLQDILIWILAHTTLSPTYKTYIIFVKAGRSVPVLGLCPPQSLFISMQWGYNINWELHKSNVDNFLLLFFFPSPCLPTYLLFSLPPVQEQYLSLHLTLIFFSSYSRLWASSLFASGCTPRACRNPDKDGISQRCKIQARAALCTVLEIWSKDCNLQEQRGAGVQVMPK